MVKKKVLSFECGVGWLAEMLFDDIKFGAVPVVDVGGDQSLLVQS